jgi:ribonuclease HI
MKYYAVKKGKVPGIYNTWAECQAQTKGFKSASYKSFTTLKEAEAFIIPTAKAIDPNGLKMWTDGSAYFKEGRAGYAFLFEVKSNVLYESYGRLDSGPYTSAHSEIIAIIEGLRYYEHYYSGRPLLVNSDSEYVINTITDWGPSRKDWTDREHADLLLPLLKWLKDRPHITLEHVSAHTGLVFNERCDTLAKQGANTIK